MLKNKLIYFGLLGVILILSGCSVRRYDLTQDRVDQNLSSGNRGYLQGQAPEIDESARKTTRTTHIVEVEIPDFKFGKKAKAAKTQSSTDMPSSQGYAEITEAGSVAGPEVKMEKYTVQKNDTLQKISQKFYGTTKKWTKIYDANKDALKGPNKIYPGQVINVPVEELKETKENLK